MSENILNLICGESGKFKAVFDAIGNIVQEIEIQVDSEGLRLNALDKAHVTFINFKLKPEFFDEFECLEPIKLGVDADELLKIFKRSRSDDIMTITADEGNMIVIYEGDGYKRRFKTRLIEIIDEIPPLPELDYNDIKVTLAMDSFKHAMKDMEFAGDKVSILIDEDYFKMFTEGIYGDTDFETLHGIKVNTPVQARYSLEKIKEMIKAEKFSNIVNISIGTDMPIFLQMPDDNGLLSFLLAPWVEKAEEEY